MTQEHCAPVVGLVGGIGSGKSAVARWVSRNASVAVIDGDEAGHRALTDPEVQQRVLARFPDVADGPDNAINRSRLAREIFGDNDTARVARADLERIVHPVIRRSLEEQIHSHRQAGDCTAILLDAAVLLEAGWDDLCDHVVFVDVPEPDRLARVTSTRHWDAAQYRARQASQWPLERKQTSANTLLDNSASLERSGQTLLELLETLPRTSSSSTSG